jgi:hypothetical protein
MRSTAERQIVEMRLAIEAHHLAYRERSGDP